MEQGGYFFLYVQHWFSFKASIGKRTNNYVELSALRLLFWLAEEHDVTLLNIFGDPHIIVKLINLHNTIHNVHLDTTLLVIVLNVLIMQTICPRYDP